MSEKRLQDELDELSDAWTELTDTVLEALHIRRLVVAVNDAYRVMADFFFGIGNTVWYIPLGALLTAVVLILAAVGLVILLSGCQADPQLMATVERSNTQIAATATAITSTPTLTASPSLTPSPSILEVTVEKTQSGPEPTPTPCQLSICEVGPVPTRLPAGQIKIEDGEYTPNLTQNARKCERLECGVVFTYPGGQPIRTEGYVYNDRGDRWVCAYILTDMTQGGKKFCASALLHIGADGKEWGRYRGIP